MVTNSGDNKWFKWHLARYLHPEDHHVARTTKADKDFAKKLDFKDLTFTVKVVDIEKIAKKSSIDISVVGYVTKRKHPIYISK